MKYADITYLIPSFAVLVAGCSNSCTLPLFFIPYLLSYSKNKTS